jgi:hypothetical protein
MSNATIVIGLDGEEIGLIQLTYEESHIQLSDVKKEHLHLIQDFAYNSYIFSQTEELFLAMLHSDSDNLIQALNLAVPIHKSRVLSEAKKKTNEKEVLIGSMTDKMLDKFTLFSMIEHLTEKYK